jgi:hypothetical protein
LCVLGLDRIAGDPALAHRALALACVLGGILGWLQVLRRDGTLPPHWQAAGLAAVVLGFPGGYSVVELHPEAFIFATTPWQILLALAALDTGISDRRRRRLLAALGLITGVAYVCKYSAALAGLPFLAITAWELARRGWRSSIRDVLGMAFAAALPVLALSLVNSAHSGAISPIAYDPNRIPSRWPTLYESLMLLNGPYQALAGSQIIIARAVDRLWSPVTAIGEFDRRALAESIAALLPLAMAFWLVVSSAPRNFLWRAAIGSNLFAAAALALLWTHRSNASCEARHFTGVSLLWFPVLPAALYSAWRRRGLAAWAGIAGLAPPALAVGLAAYAMVRADVALPPADPGGFRLEPRVDVPLLRRQVAARTGVDSSEIVWLCFEPRVLFALGGRHVDESYTPETVEYRADRPVFVVTLVPVPGQMSPDTYHRNLDRLRIDLSKPDFQNAGYAVFIRSVGPGGVDFHGT